MAAGWRVSDSAWLKSSLISHVAMDNVKAILCFLAAFLYGCPCLIHK
jgi:hypothetical protein